MGNAVVAPVRQLTKMSCTGRKYCCKMSVWSPALLPHVSQFNLTVNDESRKWLKNYNCHNVWLIQHTELESLVRDSALWVTVFFSVTLLWISCGQFSVNTAAVLKEVCWYSTYQVACIQIICNSMSNMPGFQVGFFFFYFVHVNNTQSVWSK